MRVATGCPSAPSLWMGFAHTKTSAAITTEYIRLTRPNIRTSRARRIRLGTGVALVTLATSATGRVTIFEKLRRWPVVAQLVDARLPGQLVFSELNPVE